MGLFDTIEFEDDSMLPNKEAIGFTPDNEWQTKDLDCAMLQFVVCRDKKLYLKKFKQRKATKQEEQARLKEIDAYDFGENDPFSFLTKHWRKQAKFVTELDKLEDTNYHGIIKIGQYKNDTSVDYSLKFTDGLLVEIRLIEINNYN